MPTSVPTRILVAPSGFKESLSPEGVCQAVADRAGPVWAPLAGPRSEPLALPLAPLLPLPAESAGAEVCLDSGSLS